LELDEDDESSIRASAESGEIQATFPRKRWIIWDVNKINVRF
jgi:hypothetical protein